MTRAAARSPMAISEMLRDVPGAPREVCELALAHVNTNSIEAA